MRTVGRGATLGAGARLRIELSDGAVLEEHIVVFDRPTRHVYRWDGGLRAPGKFVARAGEAAWTFSEQRGGTRIEWTYTFDLTTPLGKDCSKARRALAHFAVRPASCAATRAP